MASESNQPTITFEQWREEWLREITEPDLNTVQKGQRFAVKLITEWLDVDADDEDLVLCDGPGDGGIDIAYLHRPDIEDAEQGGQAAEGHTWYLVQSKFGTAFQGPETIIAEGQKIIETLAGNHQHLSEGTRQLVERVSLFMRQAVDIDRISIVFAADRPLVEAERRALDDVRSIAAQRFHVTFDVEDVSLQTIWEARDETQPTVLSLSMQGNFVEPSSGLRVGTISLVHLYRFLKTYQRKTGNLDQLYDKNVRKFLGTGKKINRGIAATLNERPELFGLYNNGITVVVSDFAAQADGSHILYEPYVVNGCQTTKTIWQVLQKLETGGHGRDEALESWKARVERGVVVVKLVKTSSAEANEITRYTNSQNAVRDQDFIALRNDFRSWADTMATRYGMFLEVQRGGWDAQKAYQRAHPETPQYNEAAYAFDLVKIYGAGWLREPGTAFGKNATFTPGGNIFKRITLDEENPFGVKDLYAAYRLKTVADQLQFGRGAQDPSRRQTRFLFYHVVCDFVRDTLVRGNLPSTRRDVTNAVTLLLDPENEETRGDLSQAACEAIAEYLRQDSEDTVYREPQYQGDMNTFLKWEQLGKTDESTPLLNSLLGKHKYFFGLSHGGQQSRRATALNAIKAWSGCQSED